MKRNLIIALSCLAIVVAACHKPEPEPTPEATDYSEQYVGSYLGSMTLTIMGTVDTVSVSTPMTFNFDGVALDITKGDEDNAINATVTIDNEPYQTTGTTTAEQANLETVHLNLDKPDFNVTGDITLTATPVENDSLGLSGDFSGSGTANIFGVTYPIVATGTVSGNLGKQ